VNLCPVSDKAVLVMGVSARAISLADRSQRAIRILKVALSIEVQSFGVALLARSPNSHKIEFIFLNANLMVPAGPPTIFNSDGNACGCKQHG
jgi:hypothetical protein